MTPREEGQLRVRPVSADDRDDWFRLRDALWPGSPEDHEREIAAFLAEHPEREECYIAEVDGVGMVGFAEFRLREYAEDCYTSPVGFVEGIYVSETHRRTGVGELLVAAGEAWARSRGCTEMASDRELTNEASGAFHLGLGYDETTRLVCYRKSLTPPS